MGRRAQQAVKRHHKPVTGGPVSGPYSNLPTTGPDWATPPNAGHPRGLPDSGFAPVTVTGPGCARQTTAYRDAGGKVHATRLEAIRADIVRVLREQANRGPEHLADFLMQHKDARRDLIELLAEVGT
jgi:hypothetical protein